MRIRSIRPEFWRSDDVDAMDWHTRLVFIGLWSYVDDNGVGRDRPADIAADLFAGDLSRDSRDTFARVAAALQHLSAGGQITRYRVNERDYLYINSWDVHQRIDRPGKERYPRPTCGNTPRSKSLATPSRVSRDTPSTGEGEKGRRGEVSAAAAVPANGASPTPTQRSKTITDAYAKAEPMSKWPAINGVVLKAIKAEKWSDDEIRAAVLRLAAEGRSVTTETLRIELDGLPARASPNGGRPPSASEQIARLQAMKSQPARLEIE